MSRRARKPQNAPKPHIASVLLLFVPLCAFLPDVIFYLLRVSASDDPILWQRISLRVLTVRWIIWWTMKSFVYSLDERHINFDYKELVDFFIWAMVYSLPWPISRWFKLIQHSAGSREIHHPLYNLSIYVVDVTLVRQIFELVQWIRLVPWETAYDRLWNVNTWCHAFELDDNPVGRPSQFVYFRRSEVVPLMLPILAFLPSVFWQGRETAPFDTVKWTLSSLMLWSILQLGTIKVNKNKC